MLKEQLLAESKTIDTEIKLDNIFESVDLTESVKEQFQTVFETSVKKHALALAESHINDIAEKAEEKVEEEVEKKTKEKEEKLKETCDKFFEHLATEWLTKNEVPIEKGIKADLFESMFTNLKTIFVEHNVILPEQSVDIVAELEDELQESKDTASSLFTQLQESKSQTVELKRTMMTEKAVADLTESQKEKVSNLIEGVEFDDRYEEKLNAMVEMAKTKTAEKPIVENAGMTQLDEGLNYQAGAKPAEKPVVSKNPMMDRYVAASSI